MNVRAASLRPDVLQLLLAALVSLIALTGCAATGTPSRPLPVFDGRVQEVEGVRFRIIDTQHYGFALTWFSNHELLASAAPYSAAGERENVAMNHARFTLLNANTGQARVISRPVSAVCARDGEVHFLLRSKPVGGVNTYFRGPPNDPQGIESGDHLVGPNAAFDFVWCRPRVDRSSIKPPAGWVIRDVLREGDGYLVSQEAKTEEERAKAALGWWREGERDVVPLSVRSRDLRLSETQFAPWARSYLFWPSDGRTVQDRPREYRILRLGELRLEVAQLPLGSWFNCCGGVLVRAGILFYSDGTRLGPAALVDAGYYLNVGSRAFRLLPSRAGASNPPVSPDGCRVAIPYDPSTSDVRPPARLLIIDFCV